MNKKNKSTPFLMILVLSIIATQLSLKALGVNLTPGFDTLIHSWGKVAGVIGYVYHPGLVAELDTLSNHFLCTEGKVPPETEKSCGELACNRGSDFEFAPPPPIDVNDPSVIIEEPVQEFCVKAISRSTVKRENLDDEKLAVEVLQIATEADEESVAEEAKPEAKTESLRSIAIGLATDDSEAENKNLAPQFEDKIFVREDEFEVTPKPERTKKPCQELERLKKLEEFKKLLNEFQLETEWQLVNQSKLPFEAQASMAKKYFEKNKRLRVIIKMTPLALPTPTKPDTFDILVGPEESEL